MSIKTQQGIGAVIVGGDYQGLGIVRSLGRHGVPVCVIDDESSISRYSRYCNRFVRLASLRDQEATVESVIKVGKELGLNGWVLYPTREEHVAAFSRHRSELSKIYRVPTPQWDVVRWAWDKRNTYRLARELSIPTPLTYYLTGTDTLTELEGLTPPFVIKPAIKEHFVYATRANACSRVTHSGCSGVWSFGPLMQFVSGTTYACQSLQRVIAKKAQLPKYAEAHI